MNEGKEERKKYPREEGIKEKKNIIKGRRMKGMDEGENKKEKKN